MEKPYRTVSYHKCPYCKTDFSPNISSQHVEVVGLATGSGSQNVVLTCSECGKKYRVTVLIKFNARKIEGQ